MNVALPFTHPSLSRREACSVKVTASATPTLNVPVSIVDLVVQGFDQRDFEEFRSRSNNDCGICSKRVRPMSSRLLQSPYASAQISMLHHRFIVLSWHQVMQAQRTVHCCCGNNQTELSETKSHIYRASPSPTGSKRLAVTLIDQELEGTLDTGLRRLCAPCYCCKLRSSRASYLQVVLHCSATFCPFRHLEVHGITHGNAQALCTG